MRIRLVQRALTLFVSLAACGQMDPGQGGPPVDGGQLDAAAWPFNQSWPAGSFGTLPCTRCAFNVCADKAAECAKLDVCRQHLECTFACAAEGPQTPAHSCTSQCPSREGDPVASATYDRLSSCYHDAAAASCSGVCQ